MLRCTVSELNGNVLNDSRCMSSMAHDMISSSLETMSGSKQWFSLHEQQFEYHDLAPVQDREQDLSAISPCRKAGRTTPTHHECFKATFQSF